MGKNKEPKPSKSKTGSTKELFSTSWWLTITNTECHDKNSPLKNKGKKQGSPQTRNKVQAILDGAPS